MFWLLYTFIKQFKNVLNINYDNHVNYNDKKIYEHEERTVNMSFDNSTVQIK
jgi:hypothetical protein